MYFAKSNFLNQTLIEAIKGFPDSGKLLEMVCDCCGEEVFWRKPHNRKDYEVQAAWVHKKIKETTKDCENRVNSTSKEQLLKRREQQRKERARLLETRCTQMVYLYNLQHKDYDKTSYIEMLKWLKYIRKLWKTNIPSNLMSLRDKVHLELRKAIKSEYTDELLELTFNVYLEKATKNTNKQAKYEKFANSIVLEYHIALCKELLYYVLSNHDSFNMVFTTVVMTEDASLHIQRYYADETVAAVCITFLSRILMTDWLEAFRWAKAQDEKEGKNKGFKVNHVLRKK